MSGHSHWAGIKHKKGIEDKKRGQIFSKLSRQISLAAKQKGGDPATNSTLRLTIEKAKEFNMPKENIERAVKRGKGEGEGERLEEVMFEAYGPAGIVIIIEGITDNKNRALGEVKKILSENNGKLVGEGAVKWMFDRKGCLIIVSRMLNISGGVPPVIDLKSQTDAKTKEELEMAAIESGAEDFYWHEGVLDIYTKPEELEKTRKNLEEKGFKIESSSLDWVPKEMVEINESQKAACQKLFEALDESETVQDIYSNLKI